jgi:hypothetical protein
MKSIISSSLTSFNGLNSTTNYTNGLSTETNSVVVGGFSNSMLLNNSTTTLTIPSPHQQAMNNLQGHQYKINVNFDPEKKFVIVLPQNLTA